METKESVRQQFGAVAAAYVTSAVHAQGVDLPRLADAAELTGRERVLDVGTAAGHAARALAPRAAEVIGVDLAPEMLEPARHLAAESGLTNLSFRLGDVEALPFADASFDVVCSRYSAHHYPRPVQALAEIAHVLRPGGRFILVDVVAPPEPALDTFLQTCDLLRDRSHVRNHTIVQWLGWMRAVGLDAELVDEWRIDLEFGPWVARMRTPADAVALLRGLFREASDAARTTFGIRLGADGEVESFQLPVALLRGRRP